MALKRSKAPPVTHLFELRAKCILFTIHFAFSHPTNRPFGLARLDWALRTTWFMAPCVQWSGVPPLMNPCPSPVRTDTLSPIGGEDEGAQEQG